MLDVGKNTVRFLKQTKVHVILDGRKVLKTGKSIVERYSDLTGFVEIDRNLNFEW